MYRLAIMCASSLKVSGYSFHLGEGRRAVRMHRRSDGFGPTFWPAKKSSACSWYSFDQLSRVITALRYAEADDVAARDSDMSGRNLDRVHRQPADERTPAS